MNRLSLVTLVCLLILGAGLATAQQNFDNVEIKATHVRGNIYMLNGTGGNIGVSVSSDGILIVDDKFAPLADKIRAALKEVGGGELKFILNTHWHGDHTSGNQVFGPEAPIIAHTNVRKRLATDQEIFGRTVPAAPKEAWPVITFDHAVSASSPARRIRPGCGRCSSRHCGRWHRARGDSLIIVNQRDYGYEEPTPPRPRHQGELS